MPHFPVRKPNGHFSKWEQTVNRDSYIFTVNMYDTLVVLQSWPMSVYIHIILLLLQKPHPLTQRQTRHHTLVLNKGEKCLGGFVCSGR